VPVTQKALLPVHELLAQLEAWRLDPSEQTSSALAASFARVAEAYGVNGAYLAIDALPLPELSLSAGSLLNPEPGREPGSTPRDLAIGANTGAAARLWVDGDARSADRLMGALELAIGAAWAKQEAHLRQDQLLAMDAAVRGIAGLLSVERVLQLIVDRVRDLVGAQYAALGILGSFGSIDQFVTSGMTREERAAIGPVPRGRGVLGLIIREDRPFLIDDITADPRRYGFPPHHPQMHSFLGVPVRTKGRSIGNLYLTNKLHASTFSEDDLRLVEMFALHAAIAIENARLHEEIQRLAVVEERQRISQDLHDSIIQSLYAISLSLEDLPDIINEDPSEGATRADRAIDSIHGTIRDIRNFIMGLQPELLEEADLAAGIESLAAEFQANTLIDLELRLDTSLPDLPREHAMHVLSITREALSNIARHSGATRASLEVLARDGVLRLTVGDNGRGFDPDLARTPRQRGLTNLRSRAVAAGGTLTITSEPGAGTQLEANIPIKSVGD
jgi:signal transduction histidine kinase